MRRFMALFKMNMRVLLRNKGFLFFLCIVPIVSAFILGIKTEVKLVTEESEVRNIIELKKCSERAVYVSDTSTFIVKVYDASKSELSEYVLEQLAKTGMFSICRGDAGEMSEEEVLRQAEKDAYDDRAGVLLYLKEDFDTCVRKGDYEGALTLYDVSEDERWEIFEEELTSLLFNIYQLGAGNGLDKEAVLTVLNQIREEMPDKKIVSLSSKENIVLTKEQESQKSLIGYAMSIITLGFLFCGVCVAHTVIEEQNNKVYTRVLLSKARGSEYFLSKFLMVIIISVLQTGVLGITLFVGKGMDFGIHKISFLFIIFLLGLIFSALSLLLGVLMGDVMSANYAVFTVWSVSALLAGLYFPIDSSSQVMKTVSYLMPQRWFMKAAEMLFVGDKNVYSMIICITVAYLIVIISVGSVGLKMKRTDA